MRFQKEQIVKRLGYSEKGWKVVGYNGSGMVIVVPINSTDGLFDRELFQEITLELVK